MRRIVTGISLVLIMSLLQGAAVFAKDERQPCPFNGGCRQCIKELGGEDNCREYFDCCPQQVQLVVPLIQPLDLSDNPATEIPVDFTTPQGTWIRLGATRMQWFLEVAVGVVAIWILICGGAMILVGDPNKSWRNRMITSIIGLIGLVFAGALLRFLNSLFFVP